MGTHLSRTVAEGLAFMQLIDGKPVEFHVRASDRCGVSFRWQGICIDTRFRRGGRRSRCQGRPASLR